MHKYFNSTSLNNYYSITLKQICEKSLWVLAYWTSSTKTDKL